MRLLTYHLKAPDLVRALISSIGGLLLDRVPAVRELTIRGTGRPVRGLAVGERAVRRCRNFECNRVITFEQPEERPEQGLERLVKTERRKPYMPGTDKAFCAR